MSQVIRLSEHDATLVVDHQKSVNMERFTFHINHPHMSASIYLARNQTEELVYSLVNQLNKG